VRVQPPNAAIERYLSQSIQSFDREKHAAAFYQSDECAIPSQVVPTTCNGKSGELINASTR
jgi:hypothetical protein